jgi:hypothetical protein
MMMRMSRQEQEPGLVAVVREEGGATNVALTGTEESEEPVTATMIMMTTIDTEEEEGVRIAIMIAEVVETIVMTTEAAGAGEGGRDLLPTAVEMPPCVVVGIEVAVRMTTDEVAIGVAIDMTITEEGMVGTETETETGLGTEVQTEIVADAVEETMTAMKRTAIVGVAEGLEVATAAEREIVAGMEVEVDEAATAATTTLKARSGGILLGGRIEAWLARAVARAAELATEIVTPLPLPPLYPLSILIYQT